VKIKKKSMPHVGIPSKGLADLYFEFLEPKDRTEVFEDLRDGEVIKLPNYGEVYDRIIENVLKEITKDNLDKSDMAYIQRYTTEQAQKTKSFPILEYDEENHKYKLKDKFDIEKIIEEFSKQWRKKQE